jgi:hypothetical protein
MPKKRDIIRKIVELAIFPLSIYTISLNPTSLVVIYLSYKIIYLYPY